MQRKNKPHKSADIVHKPILVIRWGGLRGMHEAEDVQDEYPCDTALQFAALREKDDVKELILSWLAAVDDQGQQIAQVLYIGSHGHKTGLLPTSKAKSSERMTWNELASVINPSQRPIVLWLGACDSSYAAEAWSQPGTNVAVQVIVGFSGVPDDQAISALLVQLVHMSNIRTRGSKPRKKVLTYLPADVRKLKRMKFKKSVVTVHYKVDDNLQPEYVEVSGFRARVGMGFEKYLDKRNVPVPRLFAEVLDSPLLRRRPKAKAKKLSSPASCRGASSTSSSSIRRRK